MNVWGITDRGKIREQNQDSFAHQSLPDGRVIALVCDGMGGARAGNIASSMAVDVFMEAFLEDGEDSPDLEHMERAAARLEQSEAVQKLRTDLAMWRARRAQARENFRQRLTWDKRMMLQGNPTARSGKYAEQLRLLRQRMAEDREERRKRKE